MFPHEILKIKHEDNNNYLLTSVLYWSVSPSFSTHQPSIVPSPGQSSPRQNPLKTLHHNNNISTPTHW